jgi:hypothetical protein
MSIDPTQSMTPMAEAVAQMHELFVSLIAGSFTERQACQIVADILRGGSGSEK